MLFELDLVAQRNPVGARHGDLRLQIGAAVINGTPMHKLWALRDQIEYDKARHGDHLALTVVDGYYEQLQQIFAEHNRTWQHIRSIEE